MKRFLKSALLVFLGLLIGLGLAEVAVRILAPHSKDRVTPPGMFAIDSTLGWKLQPGYERRHSTRYFDVEYSVNSLGFRDRERTVPKPDSVRRLLLFGDSHVFGWGIPHGQRFSDVVEASTRNLEIWNMAVPGYGFDQAVIAYLAASDSIPATGAILYVSKATLNRMNFNVLFSKPKPRFRLDAAGRASISPPALRSTALADRLYRIFSPFYLPYFVEGQAIRLFAGDLAIKLGSRDMFPVDSATMSLAKAVLMRAKENAAAHGHELYVIAALPDSSSREFGRFATSNGVTYLPTGWAIPPVGMMFGPADHHWTPRLHDQIGKRFAPILARQPVSTM